jgi:hypothetical protein
MSRSNIEFEDYCYVFSCMEELRGQMVPVLRGVDPKREARIAAADYFVDIEATRTQKFYHLLNDDTQAGLEA